MTTINISELGALADGETNNAKFIQSAIDACHENGGGRVLIPANGIFVTGTITIKSGVELHLECGAQLQASHRQEDYIFQSMAGEYGGKSGAFVIQSLDANNIAITGLGTIDGQAQAFMDGWWTDDGEYIKRPMDFRPRVMGLFGAKGLRISGITIRDAAQWTCHLTGCEDVVVHGITILNGLDIPNCDGIDPDHCRNVRISDCHIEAGDDGIVIKTTREFARYGPSENITVTGCTLVSTSAAIKIGTETHDDISNVVVTGCVIRRSHRGLAIQLRDQGNVEDVIFSDCIIETRQFHPKWWGNAEAICLTAISRHPGGVVGKIRGVLCRGIRFKGENGVFICGTPESKIEDVTLEGVDGRIGKTSKFPVTYYDMRPSESAEHGGLEEGILSGITVLHVDGLRIRDCRIRFFGEDRSHWDGSLKTVNVENFLLTGFSEDSDTGQR